MSQDKLKGFYVSSLNQSKHLLKKQEEEIKRKEEEAKAAQALKEFEQAFQEENKINRAWVKGGVVNSAIDGCKIEAASTNIYKPSPKFGKHAHKTLEVGKVESKNDGPKKPTIGKKLGQEKKKSNLEVFKEELKVLQEQRQQRHQLRNECNASNHSTDKTADTVSRPILPASDLSLEMEDAMFGRKGITDKARPMGYPYDDDTDKTTTNLFLGNLNPQMSEARLCEIFGRYGPLASVKIMWPRTEEQRATPRNCGFVAFMNRVDSERALERLRGKELLGYEMKLGWGKSVHVPAYPIYIPPALTDLMEQLKPPAQSGLPFNAQPREWLKSIKSTLQERAKIVVEGGTATPPGIDRFPFNIHTMPKEVFDEVLKEAIVKVIIPSDRIQLAIIHRVVEFVVREGPQFEAAIMHREEKNSQYKFLFDYQSPDHLYYRWKLWSILHGEKEDNWSSDEFRMYKNGPLWKPPIENFFTNGMPLSFVQEEEFPYAPTYVASSNNLTDDAFEEESRRNTTTSGERPSGEVRGVSNREDDASRRTGLSEAQRGRLACLVNDLEPSRTMVGEVMLWCLEHADSANDIADLISESLRCTTSTNSSLAFGVKPATTVQAIIARLYLTSDILYNSGAKMPNASFFRKCFETRLNDVFKNIGSFYRDIDSKLKSEQLKQKVMMCFRAWEDWAVYPNEFLIQLQNVFLGLLPYESNIGDEDIEDELAGIPLDQLSGMTAVASNVESIDGAPLVQYDGDPLDVDGSPLGSDIDGDDYEGVPLDIGGKFSESSREQKTSSPAPLFVPSKWESVDSNKIASEDKVVVPSNKWELFADSGDESDLIPPSKLPVAPAPADIDEDVDGKPLDSLAVAGLGLVAYDDDDALSPSLGAVESSPSLSKPHQSLPPSASTSSIISETRRSQLRDIELKVVKYQDELEASRKNGESKVTDEAITKQSQRYRERLMERLENDESSENNSPAPSSSHHKRSSSNKHHLSSSTSKINSRSKDTPSSSSKRSKPSTTSRKGSRSPPRSLREPPKGISRRRRSRSKSEESRLPLKRTRDDEEMEEGEAVSSGDEDSFLSIGSKKEAKSGRTRTVEECRTSRSSKASDRSPAVAPSSSTSRRSRRSRSRSPSPSRRRSTLTTSKSSAPSRSRK